MDLFALSESARRYIPKLRPLGPDRRAAALAYLVRYDCLLTEDDVAWLKRRLGADSIEHSFTDFAMSERVFHIPARTNPSRLLVRFKEHKWACRHYFDIPQSGHAPELSPIAVASVWTIGDPDNAFCREYVATGPRPMDPTTRERIRARKAILTELQALYATDD